MQWSLSLPLTTFSSQIDLRHIEWSIAETRLPVWKTISIRERVIVAS